MMMRKLFPFLDQNQQLHQQDRNTWHILPGRLSFVIGDRAPAMSANVDCFTTDHSLVYRPFNNDFGPLNMAMLFKFCDLLLAKMHSKEFLHNQKHFIYHSHATPHAMENAAFLIGSFAVLYLNLSPEFCRDQLTSRFDVQFSQYRDAGFQAHSNTITLYDCFCGLLKARNLNFFNFNLQMETSLLQLVQQSIGKQMSSSLWSGSSSSSSSTASPTNSPFQENVDFNNGLQNTQQQRPMDPNYLMKSNKSLTASGNNTQNNSQPYLSRLSQTTPPSLNTLAKVRQMPLSATTGAPSSDMYLDSPLNSASPYRLPYCSPFNVHRYEYLEDVGNGDMSWLIPGKFLALATPRDEQLESSPGNNLSPEQVIPILRNEGVKAVVRLNNRVYDRQTFVDAGIKHYDLFFPDCTIPPEHILAKFLALAEQETEPMAVHCRAGLGRTGTLIAAYMIKTFKMTAKEAISYIRVCRPGSIIGAQQDFLENIEQSLMDGSLQLNSEEDAEHAAARLRAERQETENEQQGSHAKRLLLGNMELKSRATQAMINSTITPYPLTPAQQSLPMSPKMVEEEFRQTRYQLRSQQPQSAPIALGNDTKKSLTALRLGSL